VGRKASYSATVYEPSVIGQVTRRRLDDATQQLIVRALSEAPSPHIDIDRRDWTG
jgi:hypothetical protein